MSFHLRFAFWPRQGTESTARSFSNFSERTTRYTSLLKIITPVFQIITQVPQIIIPVLQIKTPVLQIKTPVLQITSPVRQIITSPVHPLFAVLSQSFFSGTKNSIVYIYIICKTWFSKHHIPHTHQTSFLFAKCICKVFSFSYSLNLM